MALPEPINTFLQQIRNAIYGEEVRGSIVGAIEQCYADAGNLESANKQAAADADAAAASANTAAASANKIKDELQTLKAADYWRGPQGPQGESGVGALSSGMFVLTFESASGDLFAIYPDDGTPPKFEYDPASGNLYYIIDE